MKITHIIIHHTAVNTDKNSEQFDAVNNRHIAQWWGQIWYHWFIEPDWEIKEWRREWTVWAHCYQEDMNYKSIWICLTWNFDEEKPTREQEEALRYLIWKIQNRNWKLIVANHTDYAPKSCPWVFAHHLKNLTPNTMTEIDKKTVEVLIAQNSLEWNKTDSEEVKKALEECNAILREVV